MPLYKRSHVKALLSAGFHALMGCYKAVELIVLWCLWSLQCAFPSLPSTTPVGSRSQVHRRTSQDALSECVSWKLNASLPLRRSELPEISFDFCSTVFKMLFVLACLWAEEAAISVSQETLRRERLSVYL